MSTATSYMIPSSVLLQNYFKFPWKLWKCDGVNFKAISRHCFWILQQNSKCERNLLAILLSCKNLHGSSVEVALTLEGLRAETLSLPRSLAQPGTANLGRNFLSQQHPAAVGSGEALLLPPVAVQDQSQPGSL